MFRTLYMEGKNMCKCCNNNMMWEKNDFCDINKKFIMGYKCEMNCKPFYKQMDECKQMHEMPKHECNNMCHHNNCCGR